jgi:hypothetical protein
MLDVWASGVQQGDIRPEYKTEQQDKVLWAPAHDEPPAAAVLTLPSGNFLSGRSACVRSPLPDAS